MKFTVISFRVRIVITLIIVVSLFSSAAIYTYNQLLINKIYSDSEKNIENVLHFLQSEIINVHDGRQIHPILKHLERDKSFIRAYLMDGDGNITYPMTDSIRADDTTNFSRMIASDEEVQVFTTRSIRQPSSLAVLQIKNLPACYECHPSDKEKLGYVALNISLGDTKSTLKFARTFSILFTVFMILIILVFVVILHVRFIKASLSNFQIAIKKINEGNLNERVEITKASELARLGHLFNQMVDNFQRTQQELARYHQKELDNAEKLATIGEMAARLAHDVRNPLTGPAGGGGPGIGRRPE
jgi:nitrogen fixation/metabolism regulation signal transduction histidine kinase